MAPEKQWIVRYKHYVSEDLQSNHVAEIKRLTVNDAVPFHAEIDEKKSFSIGNETKGYLATFNEDTRKELDAFPEVYEIEELQYYKRVNLSQENPPWGLARLSNKGPVADREPVYTYRTEASGDGVTAYVIDTGINDNHVDFEGRASKGPTYVQDDPNSGNNDVHGHGTHVAGTIGGKTYGVAKKVELVGIKVFNDKTGSASTIDIIKALEWVVKNAPIVDSQKKAVANLSLGGPPSPAMDAAIASAVRQGIVIVVAAGNEGVDADKTSPAREPLAITVGAIDKYDQKPAWSNHGRKIDIFAPGVDVLSAWVAEDKKKSTNDEKLSISGTSMASPHVAGVAACILSDKTRKGITNPQDVIGAILIDAEKGTIGNLPSTIRSSTLAAVAKI
ncbi:hypothetical protein ACET3X_007521 [Alternaria dauci]|uniref:Peptidase S8/S53 domain-containing protein n=1 Tax=Alternaria dauci TaxID=48095 RepID=A0ABR3UC74_9PLEO